LNQPAHHNHQTFESEYTGLLNEHNIPHDMRYVFG
jgi:hypothetical protein